MGRNQDLPTLATLIKATHKKNKKFLNFRSSKILDQDQIHLQGRLTTVRWLYAIIYNIDINWQHR